MLIQGQPGGLNDAQRSTQPRNILSSYEAAFRDRVQDLSSAFAEDGLSRLKVAWRFFMTHQRLDRKLSQENFAQDEHPLQQAAGAARLCACVQA